MQSTHQSLLNTDLHHAMESKPDDSLSFLIVNYKTPALTVRCINSILENRLCHRRNIIVVDNASGDESVEYIRQNAAGVYVHEAESNAGFGSGVNLGLKLCRSEFCVILNPDTYYVDRSIFLAVKLMQEDSTLAIVGLDLRNPDLTRQYGARTYYTLLDILIRRTPLSKTEWGKHRQAQHLMKEFWGLGRPFDCDWVMGTGFVMRASVAREIGGMDTAYFLYMEDVDLCRRAKLQGHRVVAMPNVVLVHDHQRASAGCLFCQAGRNHLRSLLIYIRKYGIGLFSNTC